MTTVTVMATLPVYIPYQLALSVITVFQRITQSTVRLPWLSHFLEDRTEKP